MESVLKLLDHVSIANALASMFQRLMNFTNIIEKMFLLMMDNIWTDFRQNEEAVKRCKTEICPALWKKWEDSVFKRDVQKQILTKAYEYFVL